MNYFSCDVEYLYKSNRVYLANAELKDTYALSTSNILLCTIVKIKLLFHKVFLDPILQTIFLNPSFIPKSILDFIGELNLGNVGICELKITISRQRYGIFV